MCKIKSTQLTPGLPLGISPLHNGLHTQRQHLGTNSTGTTTKRLQLGTLKPPRTDWNSFCSFVIQNQKQQQQKKEEN